MWFYWWAAHRGVDKLAVFLRPDLALVIAVHKCKVTIFRKLSTPKAVEEAVESIYGQGNPDVLVIDRAVGEEKEGTFTSFLPADSSA